jgi:hypothetical protein
MGGKQDPIFDGCDADKHRHYIVFNGVGIWHMVVYMQWWIHIPTMVLVWSTFSTSTVFNAISYPLDPTLIFTLTNPINTIQKYAPYIISKYEGGYNRQF